MIILVVFASLSIIIINKLPLRYNVDDSNVDSVESDNIESINTINSSKKITSINLKSQDYGKYVYGYECNNSNPDLKWQLFYSDENNIYLIADDYISFDYLPNGKNGGNKKRESLFGNSGYNFYLNDIYKGYVGSADITDKRIQNLNSKYFEKQYDSTNENMKLVAYLLDIDAWSEFAGEKSEFAIGAPTLELFLNSYNKSHEDNKIEDELIVEDISGYKFLKNNLKSYIEDLYGENGDMYLGKDDKCIDLWIASPCGGDSYAGVMQVSNYTDEKYGDMFGGADGIITSAYINVDWGGIRPVVCLKNGVTLLLRDDGNFEIE